MAIKTFILKPALHAFPARQTAEFIPIELILTGSQFLYFILFFDHRT